MKRPLCMVCLSFVLALFLFQTVFPIPLYKDLKEDGSTVEQTGRVYKKEYKKDVILLYVENDAEKFLCYVKEGKTPKLGSFVSVRGNYQSFSKASNPGQFNQKRYYQILNLNYSLRNVIILKESKEYSVIKEGMYALKLKLAAGYDKVLKKKEAGILKAMVLGEKSDLGMEIKDLYKQSGISHVLAISGLHISLIGMGLHKLFKRIGVPVLPNGILCIASMIFYGMLIECGTSSFRAIFMFSTYLIGKIIGRTYDMLTALALAGVLLLIEQPLYIYHSGFLLSFLAVMGIGILVPVLEQLLPETFFKKHGKNPILRNFLASISVSFFSLPVLAYYFYEFPVYSLVLNLAVIPCMSILLPCAMVGGVLSAFDLTLGNLILIPCKWILLLYELLCERVSSIPGNTFIIGKPAVWRIFVFYILVIMSVCIYKKSKRWLIGLLLSAAIAILCVKPIMHTEITILDVGQGDCICIQEKGGAVFLIDGGSSDVSNVGTYRIIPFLKAKGISEVTYAFVSHPDSDHYNGVLECLETGKEKGIDIRYLVVSHLAFQKEEQAYKKLFQAAQKSGTKVICISADDMLKYNKTTLTCLYPSKEASPNDKNGESMMLLMEENGIKILFTGDGRIEEEKQILSKIGGVHILKAGHHGSASSTGTELLEVAKPEYALISCGRDNSYGHPAKETMNRLAKAHTKALITSETGAITITLKKQGCLIKVFCEENGNVYR